MSRAPQIRLRLSLTHTKQSTVRGSFYHTVVTHTSGTCCSQPALKGGSPGRPQVRP